jgi:hypothetical protein
MSQCGVNPCFYTKNDTFNTPIISTKRGFADSDFRRICAVGSFPEMLIAVLKKRARNGANLQAIFGVRSAGKLRKRKVNRR